MSKDNTTEAAGSFVTRIVRPHQIFDGKKPGEEVQIDVKYLAYPSTIKGTMSKTEARALKRKKAPAKPKGETSVQIAQRLMDSAKAGLNAIREAGKAAIERANAEV